MKPEDAKQREIAKDLARQLNDAGADVLIDDRDERPGVKFKDADLVGIPYRIVVGARGLEKKVVECKRRRDGQTRELPVDRAVESVAETILEERR